MTYKGAKPNRTQRRLWIAAGVLAVLAALSFAWPRPATVRSLQPLAAELPGPGVPVQLDINTAAAAQLEELPGIGPVLAQRILDRRTEEGPFEGPDDLLAVSGIGEKLLEELEPYITY